MEKDINETINRLKNLAAYLIAQGMRYEGGQVEEAASEIARMQAEIDELRRIEQERDWIEDD